ncbi:MAG: hypothetical protein SO116_00550 [Treponema sp.]|nr:hypothetical protein [Spirochaetia bacterium]MDD7014005.1 hypothetical protein [Spirochaetales bacterium]MDY4901349.1 hypothetical protein [Treponema sp.]
MNKMKKWSRGIYIVSIVAQAAFFIFAAAMAVFAVLSVVQKNSFGSFIISLNGGDAVVGTNGFQISIADGSGNVIPSALTAVCIVGIITMFFTGMIFRNLGLIFKIVQKGGERMDGESFFSTDVIRLVREIGYFCIAIPAVEFIAGVAFRLLAGELCEISVQLNGFIFGFAVLCLSQFFSYGMKLEQEIEGLV